MKRILLAVLAAALSIAPSLADASQAPGLKAQIAAIARAKQPGLRVDGRSIHLGNGIGGSTIRQISGKGTIPGKSSGGLGIGNIAPKHYTLGGFVTMQRGGKFKISVQVTKNAAQPMAAPKRQ